MKRLIAGIVASALLLISCGCTSLSGEQTAGTSSSKDSSSQTSSQPRFSLLNDDALQQYVEDDLYASLEGKFASDDYVVDNIATSYVSKEYLEEIAYNSRSNVFFGYSLDELDKQFHGQRYVFTVENNKTVVRSYEQYNDTFNTVMRNVAVGSGIILVFAAVTVATSGSGGALATVNIIAAASAKTGTAFALSSAVLDGAIAGAVTGYQTGDMGQAVKSAVKAGSEGFAWGAFTGVTLGGAGKAIRVSRAAKNGIPSPWQSEQYALKRYRGKGQVSYIGGEEVAYGTKESTRPDVVRTIRGHMEAIEVKNYDLENTASVGVLLRELKRQVTQRMKDLPKGSTQRIVLDTRNRQYSSALISDIKKQIHQACNVAYPDIPIDILR
ncbi:hypothetical protein [Bifidobacterium felsineum]|uniref:hypothetical protein n=1 Tax=Bifidobacterium felsineum TaxID=2045440 RepID=UPI001BDC7DC8|nr:hypothetical protein [Bifidobacterium felsineum]MBT1164271.1 hypothetical protein [Bifidobacterium felsineum]